jgi:hypothetical protein
MEAGGEPPLLQEFRNISVSTCASKNGYMKGDIQMSRYASVTVGKIKLPRTTLVYSLRDLQEDFHWILWDVKTERLIFESFQTDVVDLFNTLIEDYDHFQVRFVKDINSLIETLTDGNYLWIDTREVETEDGLIFFHDEHERRFKVV